jgi:hypothetical protein
VNIKLPILHEDFISLKETFAKRLPYRMLVTQIFFDKLRQSLLDKCRHVFAILPMAISNPEEMHRLNIDHIRSQDE